MSAPHTPDQSPNRDVKYQIFVSSTFKDLADERKIAVSAIMTTGNIPIALEHFSPRDERDRRHIRSTIQDCDIVILILGHRYGEFMVASDIGQDEPLHHVWAEGQISFTEYEFRLAEYYRKPIYPFILAERQIRELRIKEDPLGNEAARTQEYLTFLAEVRKRHTSAVYFKSDLADFGVKVTDAIYRARSSIEASDTSDTPASGWIRAGKFGDRRLLVSALRNEFMLGVIRSLNGFEKLDQRSMANRDEKKQAADTFTRLFMNQIIKSQIKLFLESGSSIAYVAKSLGQGLKKSIIIERESGRPTIDIRTNNILAYLQLWLLDRVPCSTFPWGYPEGSYGGFYGPISDYGSQLDEVMPRPVYQQDELRTCDAQIVPIVDRMKREQFAFKDSDHALLVGAVSGLQLGKEHHIKKSSEEDERCESIKECYGPHVGSFFNKVFKRYMYSTRLPLVIVADASKIDSEIDPDHCHFVFDTETWHRWLKESPVSFCVGATHTKRLGVDGDIRIIGSAFQALGFKVKVERENGVASIFAWNSEFQRRLQEMKVALPGLW